MTALSAVQDATVQLTGTTPAAVYGSTEQIQLELRTLLKYAGEEIAKAYEWPALLVRGSITGDGTTEAFALPSDFDRMPIKSDLYSTRSQMPLARAMDLNQWLEFEIEPVVGYPGYWIILSDGFNIRPALADAEEVRYYYLTRNAWTDAAGTAQQYPALDTDLFRLPDRLLTLALIWKWRAMKRLDYGEDMATYETALNQEAGTSKGSRILRVGRPRIGAGASYAFPGQVTT